VAELGQYLAASDLDEQDRNPIHAVVDLASKKIDEAIALLDEYLKASDAGPDGARSIRSQKTSSRLRTPPKEACRAEPA
jgi:hypothetical protein